MKILINLGTLKKGGGQNVGLNYLSVIFNGNYNLDDFVFAVPENSQIERFIQQNGRKVEYYKVPQSPLKRILFEKSKGAQLVSKYKVEIIYTIFGYGNYPKKIMQVTGSADSNLFFPEINFWSEYSGLKLLKKKIVDFYRIKALKRSHAVIFENESMMSQSKILFGLDKVLFSQPSLNTEFDNTELQISGLKPNSRKGLFLCSWQKNKNYLLIPKLAAEFKVLGIDFQFVFTAPQDNSEEHKEFEILIDKYDVRNEVLVIGTVNKEVLKSLYEQIDYVFLLSKLESFSNNIIESYYFGKLLVITDAEWSRSICKDAALYVDRNDSKDITNKIFDLEVNIQNKIALVDKIKSKIQTYPTMQEKVDKELKYIKSLYEIN